MNGHNPYGPFEDQEQADQHIRSRYVIFGERMMQVLRINPPADFENGSATVVLSDPYNPINLDPPSINDPLFNSFRFDPLGWINHQSGPVLADLIPIRQTRRGYGQENVTLYGFSQRNGDSLFAPDDVGVDQLLFGEGFREMLRNEYPSLEDVAREVFGKENISVAVSRAYVVRADDNGYTWLWRFADKIGLFLDPDTIQLGRRSAYLREEMQETALFNEGVMVK